MTVINKIDKVLNEGFFKNISNIVKLGNQITKSTANATKLANKIESDGGESLRKLVDSQIMMIMKSNVSDDLKYGFMNGYLGGVLGGIIKKQGVMGTDAQKILGWDNTTFNRAMQNLSKD